MRQLVVIYICPDSERARLSNSSKMAAQDLSPADPAEEEQWLEFWVDLQDFLNIMHRGGVPLLRGGAGLLTWSQRSRLCGAFAATAFIFRIR